MQTALSQNQLDTLNEQGFLVVERNIPYADLQAARDAADRIVQKCLDKDYPYCRSDHRLSDRFIEKIEHVLSPELFEPEILKQIVNAPLIQFAQQALQTDDLYLAFCRVHTTRKYSAWSSWHRDARTDGELYSVKLTIPLFNESGFYVIPGSHKKGNKRLDQGTGNSDICNHQNDEHRVPVKAGDILMFHSSILHRGTCAGREKHRRAHIHFNFINLLGKDIYGQVEQDYFTREEIMSQVPEAWRELLKKEVPQHYPITRQHPKAGLLGKMKQTVAKGFYYSSSLFPHAWVQSPPRWLVPFIRP